MTMPSHEVISLMPHPKNIEFANPVAASQIRGLSNSSVFWMDKDVLRYRNISRISSMRTKTLQRLSKRLTPHVANAAKLELAKRFGELE